VKKPRFTYENTSTASLARSPVMKPQIKRWVVGILGVLGFIFGLMWLGDAFRAYTVPFAVIWVAVPTFACLLLRPNLSACFTLSGLRRVQTTLMVTVVAISFFMFDSHDLRNDFGRHFVQGYHHWRGETDEGIQTDEWTARNRSGRWAVTLFDYVVFAGVFVLPTITFKATLAAIRKKEAECIYSADGKRIETYHTNV
jgi:hypothetical protein